MLDGETTPCIQGNCQESVGRLPFSQATASLVPFNVVLFHD
jgi:hypothetical protein